MANNLGGLKLLRGRLANNQCPECAAVHKPHEPHNGQSLFYQYAFYEKEGRFPTWKDAMAHCSEELKALWVKHLATHGITV